MSSFLSTSAVAALIADIAEKVGITEHAGLVAIKAHMDSLTAAPSTAAPSTPIKKTAAPVPDAPKKKGKVANAADVIAVEPTADDPLRNHKYRLQSINATLCMGRKLDLKNQIAGTRKDDAGSNGIFWTEKQCSKAPETGEKLCRFCKDKDDEVKSGKTADKHWFGRLDEPIYFKACIVGCGDFFVKYPAGIPGDVSTAPPAEYVVKAPEGVVASKKRGPKPKAEAAKPAAAKPAAEAAPIAPKAVDAAAEVVAVVVPKAAKAAVAKKEKAPAATTKTKKVTVAKTAAVPIEADWVVLMYEGRVVARNTKTNYVYEIDADIVDEGADIGKLVKKNDYIGVWKSGAVDAYDLAGATAADTDNEDED
jgi:hypothetical protein